MTCRCWACAGPKKPLPTLTGHNQRAYHGERVPWRPQRSYTVWDLFFLHEFPGLTVDEVIRDAQTERK